MFQFIHGLRVKLFIIYRTIRVNHSRHFDTDETTATGRIGQQVFLITRSDKWSIPAHFEHGTGMRFPHIYHRLLQNMFQEALLCRTDLIKFINIDERKTIEIKFRIFLSREINAVSIIGTFRRWHYTPAKGRFSRPLRPDQQWRNTVRVFFIIPSPMRNHIEKPAVKQVCPIRIPARNGSCQFTDTVFTVPSGKSIEKILQRIEYRHAIWIDITADIPVPQWNTLHLCIQGNAIQRPFVERIETKTERQPFPIFHLSDLCVIAKFITAFHEFFGL